ncbi:hypothetical protein BKA00_006330 [Actinomadura coerulea]|uniref:PRTase associated wHTH domain-containing protein n=1 Tax=Actinomadura coerulea TaxID=46159 RepID=A0A7X0G711_9ACTN|nr:hypothetical protein [Actinomadura coerulea]MBB6399416.1 hypothetical protein [Actinomadura coerulea]
MTAPILPRRGLDLFERVVLGLCHAGVREPDLIAARINLHVRLCAHIIDQAVRQGLLDRRGELTEQGRRALRTGSVAEETSWSVRYVFQSPEAGGDLWPRTAERLVDAHVTWRAPGRAGLQLGTTGHPDHIEAAILDRADAGPGAAVPGRPAPEQIIEVARLDRDAREAQRVREFERVQGLAPAARPGETAGARPGPDGDRPPDLSRIAFIDAPEPVLVVGFAVVGGGGELVAHDPFGVGTSAMFGGLLERCLHDGGALAERIRGVTRRRAEDAERTYLQAEATARAHVESVLVREFGADVRGDDDALDLMTDVDLAVMLGDQPRALERVVHATHRLYEELFRRLARAYPVAAGSVRAVSSTPALRRAAIEEAAHGVGFQAVPQLFVQDLCKAARDVKAGKDVALKEAGALALVAAHRNAEHPLHRLAARRPDLLSALASLGAMRNRVSHGGRDPSAAQDAKWCRELAALAVPELISLH